MPNPQYSQCAKCKRKYPIEKLIPSDGGARMLCEECFREENPS